VEGSRLDAGAIRAAGEAALEVVDAGSDVRASAEYRRHLVPIFVERALEGLRHA
jgi:carbon-monoxide dehydrogenase medium subunit